MSIIQQEKRLALGAHQVASEHGRVDTGLGPFSLLGERDVSAVARLSRLCATQVSAAHVALQLLTIPTNADSL
ncbi:hypothetical protein [Bradyrhizobium guangdongense]|uniref:hypothetical protein n=1 Tax=Bradyrhizobium guangdongense TaxID=1325090 RepID=UPI00112784C2|nr:hypothetical protein [Bradyrhizobium guangdongense]